MPTPTLNTQGGALLPQNNGGQGPASAFGTPTALNTFVGGVATLPGIPNPTPPPSKTLTVVTPKNAQADLATKQDTTTQVAAATAAQTQAQLAKMGQPATAAINPDGSPANTQTAAPQQNTTTGTQTGTGTGYTPGKDDTSVTLPNGVQAFYNPASQQLTTATGQNLTWNGSAWIDPTTGQAPNVQGTTGQGGTTTPPVTGDPTTDYVNNQLAANQTLADQASATHQQQLAQILNGTFPLTADQQAQVAGLQSQLDQLRSQQQQANQNYVDATTILGIRSGAQQYAPAFAQGQITQAISQGVTKLAALDTQASASVASLKTGFLNNDYTLINSAYKDLTDAITAKDATLAAMQANVKEQVDIQTAKTQNATAQLANQTAKINSVAQSALTQALKLDGTLDIAKIQAIAATNGVDPQALYGAVTKAQQDETTFQQGEATFASQQLQAAATLESTKATTANTEATTAKTYNDIAQSNLVGQDAVLDPYTQTFYDGTKYADLSSLTPSDKAKYAQIAQAAGIKPILDAGTAGKLNAISASKENLTKIDDQVKGILNNSEQPSSQGIGNSLKSFLGNADIKAFSAWRTAVINNVQALAGGQGSGLRINQAEIDTALQNDLPVITGPNADNLATAQKKIANLNTQLDTWSKQILGGGNQSSTSAPSVTAGSTITYNGAQYSVDAEGNLTPQ